MILLIPINEFEILEVKVDSEYDSITKKVGSSKILIETMKRACFRIRRDFFGNCIDITSILGLIIKGVVSYTIMLLIFKDAYSFLNSLLLGA